MSDIGGWAIIGLYLAGLVALCVRLVQWFMRRGWLSTAPLPWEEPPRSHVRVVRDEGGET